MIKLKNQCLIQSKLSEVTSHTSFSHLEVNKIKKEKEQANKQFSFLAPPTSVEVKPFKNVIKGIVGHPLNSATLNHYTSKEIVYSFNKVNNLNPLLTSGALENLLKSFFLSMYSLISKPIYLIRHDKVIIRLFVFLSPKAEKYLDTSTIVKENKLHGQSLALFAPHKGKGGRSFLGGALSLAQGGKRKSLAQRLRRFLKFKSLRPKTVEILNTQIKLGPTPGNSLFNLPSLALATPHALSLSLDSRSLMPMAKDRGGVEGKACKASVRCVKQEKVGGEVSPFPLAFGPKGGEQVTYPYTSLMSNFKNSLEKLSVIFSKILKKKSRI